LTNKQCPERRERPGIKERCIRDLNLEECLNREKRQRRTCNGMCDTEINPRSKKPSTASIDLMPLNDCAKRKINYEHDQNVRGGLGTLDRNLETLDWITFQFDANQLPRYQEGTHSAVDFACARIRVAQRRNICFGANLRFSLIKGCRSRALSFWYYCIVTTRIHDSADRIDDHVVISAVSRSANVGHAVARKIHFHA